jgi:hypothetical protein
MIYSMDQNQDVGKENYIDVLKAIRNQAALRERKEQQEQQEQQQKQIEAEKQKQIKVEQKDENMDNKLVQSMLNHYIIQGAIKYLYKRNLELEQQEKRAENEREEREKKEKEQEKYDIEFLNGITVENYKDLGVTQEFVDRITNVPYDSKYAVEDILKLLKIYEKKNNQQEIKDSKRIFAPNSFHFKIKYALVYEIKEIYDRLTAKVYNQIDFQHLKLIKEAGLLNECIVPKEDASEHKIKYIRKYFKKRNYDQGMVKPYLCVLFILNLYLRKYFLENNLFGSEMRLNVVMFIWNVVATLFICHVTHPFYTDTELGDKIKERTFQLGVVFILRLVIALLYTLSKKNISPKEILLRTFCN